MDADEEALMRKAGRQEFFGLGYFSCVSNLEP
jgi:hypothetical protein